MLTQLIIIILAAQTYLQTLASGNGISEIEQLEEMRLVREEQFESKILLQLNQIKLMISNINSTLQRHQIEITSLKNNTKNGNVVFVPGFNNSEDEINRATVPQRNLRHRKRNSSEFISCANDEFFCSESRRQKCIPISQVCDGDNDCGNLQDERNCTRKIVCNALQFTCLNNTEAIKCISWRHLCDGENDCGNYYDESNCLGEGSPCDFGEFPCRIGNSTTKCLENHFACDGNNDCGNFEDELNCDKKECTIVSLPCPTTLKCINLFSLCDRQNDCGNNEDEEMCTRNSLSCPLSLFSCSHSNRCLSQRLVCDGNNDCGDWEDEKHCVAGDINGLFICPGTYKKIASDNVCDGDNDCGNNADEVNCFKNSTYCTQDKYVCEGTDKCLHHRVVCNDINDCGNSEDESNCNKKWSEVYQMVKPGLPALLDHDRGCRGTVFHVLKIKMEKSVYRKLTFAMVITIVETMKMK